MFCHPNLICPVTVYVVKSLNSAHIHRMFLLVHCNISIPRHFSYWRRGSVTSFSLPSSNLLSSPGFTSHPPPSTLKLNLAPRHSFSCETPSPWNFQHVSSSINFLFNVILLNQWTQNISF